MKTIAQLEQTLSTVAGTKVEITIRGEKQFTFSTVEVSKTAAEKIKAYFKYQYKTLTVEHDEECGTFIYMNV